MKKKIKYTLLILLLLTAVVMLTNVYKIFLKPLEVGTEIKKNWGDVILVLGGGLRKGREIGYSTEERLLLAIRLFKQKKRMIIISGGSLYRGSPAIKKITDFLVGKGVTPEYIKFEGKSQTTFEHFLNTRKMIEEMKSKEVIVCTSPYHQGRARMILRYLEFDNFKIARMKHSEIYSAGSIGQRLRNLKLVIREYMAIMKFKIFKK
ncbi:MAG: YdcF family protein [bacterium]|nr:YdcF family protein [bacterium]